MLVYMSTDQDTTPSIETITEVVDTYLAAWNETDSAKRAEMIEASLGTDLWYRDPMLAADGRDAFDATLAAVQEQMPGHVMTRTSGIDHHHDLVRFNWALGVPGQEPAFAGVDMAKYDEDGKLHRIVGFAGDTVA
jgi:hypothetical protein